jgi:hypothetical protein
MRLWDGRAVLAARSHRFFCLKGSGLAWASVRPIWEMSSLGYLEPSVIAWFAGVRPQVPEQPLRRGETHQSGVELASPQQADIGVLSEPCAGSLAARHPKARAVRLPHEHVVETFL